MVALIYAGRSTRDLNSSKSSLAARASSNIFRAAKVHVQAADLQANTYWQTGDRPLGQWIRNGNAHRGRRTVLTDLFQGIQQPLFASPLDGELRAGFQSFQLPHQLRTVNE